MTPTIHCLSRSWVACDRRHDLKCGDCSISSISPASSSVTHSTTTLPASVAWCFLPSQLRRLIQAAPCMNELERRGVIWSWAMIPAAQHFDLCMQYQVSDIRCTTYKRSAEQPRRSKNRFRIRGARISPGSTPHDERIDRKLLIDTGSWLEVAK